MHVGMLLDFLCCFIDLLVCLCTKHHTVLIINLISISINPPILFFFKVVLAVHEFFINLEPIVNFHIPLTPYTYWYTHCWEFYIDCIDLGKFTDFQKWVLQSMNMYRPSFVICLLKSLFIVLHSVIDFCVEILDIFSYI